MRSAAEIEAFALEHSNLDISSKKDVARSHELSEAIRDSLCQLSEMEFSYCFKLPKASEWAAFLTFEMPRLACHRPSAIKILKKLATEDGPAALTAQWKLEEIESDA